MKLEDFTKDSISCKNTTIEPFGDRLISKEPISTSKISVTAKETKIMFDKHLTEDKVELIIGNDFEIKEENGKWFVVKKKQPYPKTCEDCCNVLGINSADNDNRGYRWELLCCLQELIICRDAYWKIANDWKPDEIYGDMYCISNGGGALITFKMQGGHRLLAFPTIEMRDAFYDNFKDLIELCKEVL